MEPRLDGADGHTDDVGDLGQRKTGVVVEDEDRAVLRRQARERALQAVAILDASPSGRGRRVPPSAGRGCGVLQRRCTTELVVAGVDEQPVEPRSEPFRVAKLRELAPGQEECLLDGVLRPFRDRAGCGTRSRSTGCRRGRRVP